LQELCADLHIHIGSAKGRAVKITASRSLQLRNIIYRDAPRKGLDVAGIVDAGSTLVTAELEEMLMAGDLIELEKGGFLARNGVLVITGCEVETREGVHLLSYLPTFQSLKQWQKYINPRVHNMTLSTQRVDASVADIIRLCISLEGIFCPAHAFTPHKGVYGVWTEKLASKLDSEFYHIKAIELGLSSDTDMADMLEETQRFTYLSNSDAHSSPNIGREYNQLLMMSKNFLELRLCLEKKEGRMVLANYGLHPRLGKYHRSYCPACDQISVHEPPVRFCRLCGSSKIVMGVWDRIVEIRDSHDPRHPEGRPPYYYRIPLKDLPGIGPRTYAKLLQYFPNEIELMEKTSIEEISRVAGTNVATTIKDMRQGRLGITTGGGGKYGKVRKGRSDQ
jgi:uncharacterized protein (TIGR00375 family)